MNDPSGPAEFATGFSGRLLLVDPVESSRSAMAARLRSLGFEVDSAEDGVEGAAMALRNPPVAIIADLWMPGVSGIQLCRLLRAESATSATPVVLRGDEDDRRNRFWAEHSGAFALVGKGRVGELVRVLRRAIATAPALDGFFLQLAGSTAIRDRIARHLDAALFESVIAAEIRALSICDTTRQVFDLLSQFLSQIQAYRWLGLRVDASGFFGVHHRAGTDGAALVEAREVLDCALDPAFVLEDDDPSRAPDGPDPLVEPIVFGGRTVGVLALAPERKCGVEVADLVRVVARELGGPLRMTHLVEETQKLAATDGLTRLMNRRAFVEWADREVARIERYEGSLAVALLDVDHFKLGNDRHGHGNGDRVLAHVARVVSDQLRAGDVAARWGGEEIVLAFPGASIEGARVAVERVRSAIAACETPVDGEAPIRVTASIGVASRRGDESLDALIERADAALYAAKRAGRDRVVSAEPAPEPARAPRERRVTSITGLAAVGGRASPSDEVVVSHRSTRSL
jgi:two-component system cell cycle response regulator